MTRTHFICMLLLAGLLSACGTPSETVSDPAGTPLEMVTELIHSQADIPPMEILSSGEEGFAGYLTQIYGVPEEELTDGALCYAGGTEASELAVLAFSDEDAAGAAESVLLDYIKSRADSFTGYVPDQAALVESSTAVRQGRYAALLICADPAAAREAFLSCFEEDWKPAPDEPVSQIPELPEDVPERTETLTELPDEPDTQANSTPEDETEPPAEPVAERPAETPAEDGPAVEPAPAEPEMPEAETPVSPPKDEPSATLEDGGSDDYSHAAVVSAWQRGDASGLSEKNRAIYDAAAKVISQVITDNMTPYQKELAIHDYLTGHCQYDEDANSNALDASPDPDNGNPYGMLVHGVGICGGYSSTFQLFMDLLDIECITVPGRSGEQEHAWNMVRLDGEWYCVDVTWDDPSGGAPGHRYFNVTSEFLRNNRHQWEASGIPEAAASRWAYQG